MVFLNSLKMQTCAKILQIHQQVIRICTKVAMTPKNCVNTIHLKLKLASLRPLCTESKHSSYTFSKADHTKGGGSCIPFIPNIVV